MVPALSHVDLSSLVAFDRGSIARALNLIEDRRRDHQAQAVGLLDEIAHLPAAAHVVGLTGPPGVGKSSLISRLVVRFVENQRRVAIIAVDPSSTISGGALLGDRARLQLPSDVQVFVRSFAARDRLGGLSRDACTAVFLLRSCCDIVLVETVGVGQSETDIARVADTTVVVVQPFSGDVLQYIKSGVTEIPDILAVNKADNSALAEQAVSRVRAALALEARVTARPQKNATWDTPLLAVSAATDLNIAALARAIAEHVRHLHATLDVAERRADQQFDWLIAEILHEVGKRGLAAMGGVAGVRAACDRQPAGWSVIHRLTALVEQVQYRV